MRTEFTSSELLGNAKDYHTVDADTLQDSLALLDAAYEKHLGNITELQQRLEQEERKLMDCIQSIEKVKGIIKTLPHEYRVGGKKIKQAAEMSLSL